MQEALFYGFSLERHVPDDHLARKIDRFVDLSEVRTHLEPYYSETGRPSIDPELMIRMLIVGYCFGIRSERRLCDEVHLNLAYRWFCRLGLDGDVPDHSTFSKNRHGRFRESDLLRKLFETVVARCMKERIVGGEAFAVDASIIVADAHRRRSVAKAEDLDPTSSRAVAEYLSVLDDAAFGGSRPVEPVARALWTPSRVSALTGLEPMPLFLSCCFNQLTVCNILLHINSSSLANVKPERQPPVEVYQVEAAVIVGKDLWTAARESYPRRHRRADTPSSRCRRRPTR